VDKSLLDIRLKDADPEVFRVVKSKLEQIVSAYNARGNLLQQVKVAIENQLNSGSPSLESVASQLDMKPWTLRRKLRGEDCDFTTLLDDIRKQLAHRFLQDKNFPISDIAAALGYSEQSAFNRAFKRWYQCTPVEYRSRNH
ncbi:MAG TPA: AraC family transcriptional regulator, partial [Pseudomonadales bacterium]|nr:AraC family transcriptional regulator [Pseudomonadales bacterium]